MKNNNIFDVNKMFSNIVKAQTNFLKIIEKENENVEEKEQIQEEKNKTTI